MYIRTARTGERRARQSTYYDLLVFDNHIWYNYVQAIILVGEGTVEREWGRDAGRDGQRGREIRSRKANAFPTIQQQRKQICCLSRRDTQLYFCVLKKLWGRMVGGLFDWPYMGIFITRRSHREIVSNNVKLEAPASRWSQSLRRKGISI